MEWDAAVRRYDGGFAARHEASVRGGRLQVAPVDALEGDAWQMMPESWKRLRYCTSLHEGVELLMRCYRVDRLRKVSCWNRKTLYYQPIFTCVIQLRWSATCLRPILVLRKFGSGAQDWRCTLRLITRPQPNVK